MRTVSLLIILLFSDLIVCGQKNFEGSFLMSFYKDGKASEDPAMLWTIDSASGGGRMAMQIQDTSLFKRVNKRVIFNPKDSTWTMLMEIYNIKQGTRIHHAMIYRDSVEEILPDVKLTAERKVIEGFRCRKYSIAGQNYTAEAWVTNAFNFNLCFLYKLLRHCGMTSAFIRHGDWYKSRDGKGMILELTSTNRKTKENYTIKLTQIQSGQIRNDFFQTSGYKISEIPEGQNCGVDAEEKE